MTTFALGMIPLVMTSLGLLYIYYVHCHPWVSEGVSVGFEPLDNEIWEPDLTTSKGKYICNCSILRYFLFSMIHDHIYVSTGKEPKWGQGKWHSHIIPHEERKKLTFSPSKFLCCKLQCSQKTPEQREMLNMDY